MIRNTLTLSFLASSLATQHFTNNTATELYAWKEFKDTYHKTYETVAEDMSRFAIFVKNLRLIDLRNANEEASGRKNHAIHGVTKFADLTPLEFSERYLTTDISQAVEAVSAGASADDTVPEVAVGATADWSGVYTTPVKNQGYCGSCWAFSVVEQIEADANRLFGYTGILSEQELVDCDGDDSGCGGGWPTNAYEWIESEGGLETEEDYAYSSAGGSSGTCQADESKFVVTITDYAQLRTETKMGSYVAATGPLSIVVDASTWSSYVGGILTSCGSSIDHGVQAVGVDTDSTDGYWKIRNSWGTDWGESGYIRIGYGSDLCAITTLATYTTAVAV